MKALILVDLQYDFMPEGALAVPCGDEVVEVADRLMDRFDLVVASRDWHPANHGSFASQHPGLKAGDFVKLDGIDQVLWPDHCVENTRGAMLHHGLRSERIRKIVDKGTDPKIDSYSAFFDNAHRRATGLGEFLRSEDVDEVFLMGLATDYCVRASVLDAVRLGFRTAVVEDGCRAIELRPGDSDKAFEEMRQVGAQIVRSEDLAAGAALG